MINFVIFIAALALIFLGWRGFRVVMIIGLVVLGFLALGLYSISNDLERKAASDPTSSAMLDKATEAYARQRGEKVAATPVQSPTVAQKADATYQKAIVKRKQEIQQRIVALRSTYPPMQSATTPQELMQQHIEKERRTLLETQILSGEENKPIYPDFTPAELEYRW